MWVAIRVGVMVVCFRDSFSVLVRAQQLSMLTVRDCNHTTLYGLLGLILNHTTGCDILLNRCLCLYVYICVLALKAPHANAKIQPQ